MNFIFALFLILSVSAAAISLIMAIKAYKKKKYSRGLFQPMLIITVGLFISMWLIYIPAYFTAYDFGDQYTYARPVLIAFTDAIRAFIVEYSYDFIVEASAGLAGFVKIPYTLYTAILYILAPAATAGNILSLFKSFRSELYIHLNRKAPFYIMSELNYNSLILAESIGDKYENALIIFADSDGDEDSELFREAEKMGAMCIKKDMGDFDLAGRKNSTELFFISEDKSKNVRQAADIIGGIDFDVTMPLRLFVFSDEQSDARIIDSLLYDDKLNAYDENGFMFKVRRVDCIRQLVWTEVPKMELFKTAKNNTISVLIAGFGKLGLEFVKMISWFCCAEGMRLEINIIDKNENIQSVLRHNCPGFGELEKIQDISVKCFSGVDMGASDFRDIIEYSGDDTDKTAAAERLRRTTAVITALGDDNINIEAAMYIVSVFDKERLQGGVRDIPKVFSVVYDDKMSIPPNLSPEKKAEPPVEGNDEDKTKIINIVEYDNTPYNINFIGGLGAKYSYDTIYKDALEIEAYQYHIEWAKLVTEKDVKDEKIKFEKFEYFRDSSMARAIHKDAIAEYFKEQLNGGEEETEFLKRTEHLRWNAYMCSCGFEFNEVKSSLGKTHNNIATWKKLTEKDKLKD